MKTDLIQQRSVHSESHPAVKALKKRIAALEQEIADATKEKVDPSSPDKGASAKLINAGERRETLQKDLDEASKKLNAARLGENMERDQQAEHLQVIEQPAVPQTPVRPNRPKLYAISFALAMMIGIGSVVMAETLDKTIRGAGDLAGVLDSRLLVVIPYITTAGEVARRRRRIILAWVALAMLLIAGLAAAFYVGVEIDFSWFDRSWIDTLTRLTK